MHLWHTGKWTHAEWNPHETTNICTLTHGKVISLVTETKETINPCTCDTWESELTAEWNPDEITKLCTSGTRESELTGKGNPNSLVDETTKPGHADTGETELTGEGNLMKSINQASLKHESELTGEWNPDEITNLIKSVNHTPLTNGNVNSLVNETLMKPEAMCLWNTGKWTHWWMKP